MIKFTTTGTKCRDCHNAERGHKTQQELVDEWNAKYPVGTHVTFFWLMNPTHQPFDTRTRSPAWVRGGHSAMVMVEGVAGGVSLKFVFPNIE